MTSLLPLPVRTGTGLLAGARAAVPFVVGLAPFGLTVGAAVGASADPVAAWAGTLLLYSGSAQLALLQLLADGAPVWTAVLAAALVNARLLVYAGALAPLWAGAPLWSKVLGAATVVEPTWAVAEQRRRSGAPPEGARTHYAGAAIAVTLGWGAAVTAGSVVGRVDGVATHLAVAVPLCLVVLVVPHLRLPGGVVAVVAGAGTALAVHAVVPGAEVLPAMAAAALAGGLAGGAPRRART
ncbi:AzlC family ABC transporter permease [Geodermatophilus sp. SYSU D00815]